MPSPSPGRSPWARRCAGSCSSWSSRCPPPPASRARSRPGRPSASVATTDRCALASHPVPTRTKIHRVYGRLPDARRKVVRTQVGKVVDRWWDAAYLGGSYPRSSFPAAFPGFTDGRREARQVATRRC